MKRNLINKFAPFKAYEGTTEVELVSSLNIINDNLFDKYVGNAFSNDKLDSFLKENNIDTVEVIGVDGGGCVSLIALCFQNNIPVAFAQCQLRNDYVEGTESSPMGYLEANRIICFTKKL